MKRFRKLAIKIQTGAISTMTAVSFLLLIFYLGYIIFYTIIDTDIKRAVLGCVCLLTMLHFNKSL